MHRSACDVILEIVHTLGTGELAKHFGNILGVDVVHTVDRSSNDLLLINKKIHRGSLVLPIMILKH